MAADNQPITRKRVMSKWGLNPFPWYEQMLQENPVHYDPGEQGWDVFRYQNVKQVLLSPDLYSSARGKSQEENSNLVSLDPPRHTQVRTVVSQAFTACLPGEERIRSLVTRLLDEEAANGQLELIADLAIPLPILLIAETLGIPEEDQTAVKNWSKAFVSPAGKQAEQAMAHYFLDLIAHKRQHPGNDLTSLLLTAQIDGAPLTMSEIVTNCMLMLVAGNETTTNLIGNAMHCFEEYPAALQQIRDDPARLPLALEEVLRFRSPIQRTPRIAKTDVTIAGETIQAGQMVYCWLGAANRDPEQFPNPNLFDINRTPNRHLAFGQGIHFCLGAALARQQARIALERLFNRFRDIQRDQPLEPADTFFGLGVKAYHVTLQPR